MPDSPLSVERNTSDTPESPAQIRSFCASARSCVRVLQRGASYRVRRCNESIQSNRNGGLVKIRPTKSDSRNSEDGEMRRRILSKASPRCFQHFTGAAARSPCGHSPEQDDGFATAAHAAQGFAAQRGSARAAGTHYTPPHRSPPRRCGPLAAAIHRARAGCRKAVRVSRLAARRHGSFLGESAYAASSDTCMQSQPPPLRT
jgi:hypothetical protein